MANQCAKGAIMRQKMRCSQMTKTPYNVLSGKRIKVFIDPGHGGHDPGAIGSNSKEAENVLAVALALEKKLITQGYEVKLSRRTNVYVSLNDRANMANNWGADIFMSLHDNSAVNKTATGFETFIFNGQVSSNTVKLQKSLHESIIKGIGLRDRGMKRANFAVIRLTKMPAVLIEYGFISNLTDEKVIGFEIDKQAQLTYEGINNYYSVKPSNSVTVTKPEAAVPVGNKEARKFDINSPALKELIEGVLASKAQREILVNYAIAEGMNKSWLEKLENRTITEDEILALAAVSVVNSFLEK